LPAAVTATLPGPPASVIDCVVGAIEYVHDGAAADCVTVNACPAIVSVPVRAAPAFALTVNATVPLPLPEPPLEIAIQLAFDAAVHAQPALVANATEPLPPAAVNDALVGAMAYAQEMPACATAKVRPAIVSEPWRVAWPEFAATLKRTCPGPVPLAPETIEIQFAFAA